MDYNPAEPGLDLRALGFRHNPLKALVFPRPIGWISTKSAKGIPNLAPYSFFNMINDQPPMVMFASSDQKDTLTNATSTGVFAYNLATKPMFDAMNASSATVMSDVNEFELAGIEMGQCKLIDAPYVAASPMHMECVVHRVIDLPSSQTPPARPAMVIAEVKHIRIDDDFIVDGMVDQRALQTIARCGYKDYALADTFFSADRPG